MVRTGFRLALQLSRYARAGGLSLVALAAMCSELSGQPEPRRGPQILKLADVPFPLSVSPDARRIAEIGFSGNLAMRVVESGDVRNLTRATLPQLVMNGAFSPTSDRIAFAWHNEEDHDDLRVVGIDGSESRVLFRDPAVRSIWVKGWSPDGSHVLVTIQYRDAAGAVALVSESGGTPNVIASFEPQGEGLPELMAFSPDGGLIAFDRASDAEGARHDIFMMDATGQQRVALTRNPGDDRLIGWSPSGDGVVFASDRSGSVDIWFQPISEGEPDGTPTMLLSDVGQLIPLGSAADGTYYIGRVDCDCSLVVSEVHVDGGTPVEPSRVLAPALHNTGAYWSRDGEHLASIEPIGGVIPPGMGVLRGAWALVVRTADGNIDKRWPIPVNVLHQLRPMWSPDGVTVLVKGWDRRAYPREVVLGVDTESGRIRTLLSSPSVWERQLDWLTWSADGRSLFYTDQQSNGATGLFRWDLESQREEALLTSTPPPFYYGLATSPDGSSLAFSVWDTSRRLSSLVVLDLVTRDRSPLAEVPLPSSIGPPAWSPDSRYVLYGVGDQLWRVKRSGGKPERIHAAGTFGYNRAGLSIHPGGNRFAFVRERGNSSAVWAIEGLFPPP
jgi:Tol biopolymer transport system component